MKNLVTIDCEYIMPRFAAAYLVHDGSEAYFVETNTTHAVPRMLEALRKEGLTPDQVKYVMITHVHLDHAGGCHALMKACPNATLLAHPRAAKHVIDPSRLIESAKKVYGEEAYRKLYGEISPVDATRVRSVADQEEIGGVRFLHTRGHANHHVCIFDEELNGLFTGDSFGLAYPALQRNGLFIFPSTSPTDFDPEEAKKSVRLICETGARRLFLTHFGELTEVEEAAKQLLEQLDFSEKVFENAVQSGFTEPRLTQVCQELLMKNFKTALNTRGLSLSDDEWHWLRLDLELNAAGIAYSAMKRRAQARA
ncbi:MAG TPA: MBL fold metallo-hydrolase [Bdellovibrionota bacterium]|nr:MBL fold metallo-hydrolase [Bdellovibrionota bacterium]